jgi:hypothetical protein
MPLAVEVIHRQLGVFRVSLRDGGQFSAVVSATVLVLAVVMRPAAGPRMQHSRTSTTRRKRQLEVDALASAP